MIAMLLMFVLAASADVSAQSAPPTQPTVAQDEKDSKTRMICISEPVTGSMMYKKRCQTAFDWEVTNRNGAAAAEELQRQHMIATQVQQQRR
jgi:hypothetical protein